MNKHEINVYIEPKLQIPIRATWLKNAVNKILCALAIKKPSEVGVVITNSEVIQQLNKLYRDKDEPTDVLSFYMLTQQDKDIAFITPPDGVAHLGEIVISYPQALIQAENKGHSIKHELFILLIHGVLHLLGYDHERSPKERQRMQAREREVLKRLMSQQIQIEGTISYSTHADQEE